ncbi:MAG: ClbS/DfsB family four-helix bundle protein [Pyrinomonadaceae bacterium]
MGKRLSKPALIVEIEDERARFDEVLAKTGKDRMTKTGVTPGGWSVKDIVGHLIGWQQLILSFHAAEARGEVPEVPGHGLTWRETPKLNQLIYIDYRTVPLEQVLRSQD